MGKEISENKYIYKKLGVIYMLMSKSNKYISLEA